MLLFQLRIINVELVIYLIAACSNGPIYGVQVDLELRPLLHLLLFQVP
jgi:hypothetical protein